MGLAEDAEVLAERPVEVVKTMDGRYVVLWLSFDAPPPAAGDTPEKALENFVSMMLLRRDADAIVPPD